MEATVVNDGGRGWKRADAWQGDLYGSSVAQLRGNATRTKNKAMARFDWDLQRQGTKIGPVLSYNLDCLSNDVW